MTTNQAADYIGQHGFELQITWELTRFNNGERGYVPTFHLYLEGRIQEESRHLTLSKGIQWMRHTVRRLEQAKRLK